MVTEIVKIDFEYEADSTTITQPLIHKKNKKSNSPRAFSFIDQIAAFGARNNFSEHYALPPKGSIETKPKLGGLKFRQI
jgi:hypothetical protein